MTEGSRTVAAQPRLTEFDLLALYDQLTVALQRVSAATRMHQTECARLHGRGSLNDMRTAWQNATEVLEAAEMSACHAHDQILAQALTVGRALRATELDE